MIGDLDAAIAVNVGEPGGSQTHAVSHSHVVQSTRITQSRTKRDGPAAAPQADDPKEDA
ncbi:MAG: hypothetical protein QOE11_2173 [Solirubrobacteraceae bacterium]|nr:hypothetical protein [Solirubrobacteraceae bacterium]